jgi:hypothetical protein
MKISDLGFYACLRSRLPTPDAIISSPTYGSSGGVQDDAVGDRRDARRLWQDPTASRKSDFRSGWKTVSPAMGPHLFQIDDPNVRSGSIADAFARNEVEARR